MVDCGKDFFQTYAYLRNITAPFLLLHEDSCQPSPLQATLSKSKTFLL